MAKITQVDILRHGLPEGDKCLRGHTDFALTQKGFQQMTNAVSDIKHLDVIMSSSLKRCQYFADHLADKLNVSVEHSDQWREINFGDWDGLSHHELMHRFGDESEQYWQDPWQVCTEGNALHNGERIIDFDVRIDHAWQQLLYHHQGKKILLVTHAGVMKQLLRLLFDMPNNTHYLYRIQFPYAARMRITIYHDTEKNWPQLQWPPYVDSL
jgi:alpha-ribazole phosphatase